MLNRLCMLVTLCGLSMMAHAEIDMTDCDPVPPPMPGSFGPFDYNDPVERAKSPLVENAHFTPQVENLTRGQTGQAVMPDIQYTLTKYPNHPRALQSLVRLSMREKSERLPGSVRSVTCFLKRAAVFAPKDLVPRMLLAKHLAQSGKSDEAMKVLKEAEELSPEDANLAYNMGLLYVEKKQYDKALTSAHKAYLAGFPLPGLRDKLKKAGKWTEPKPAPVVETTKPADVTPQPEAGNKSASGATAASDTAKPDDASKPTVESPTSTDPAITPPADTKPAGTH
ncbi:tetratricopeptide repeat protein [Chitinivorax sp. B]|uniref:tetratricopeptide repeat protein n=1 Tax=Chitinivorax sp. B TaxID=2502235 RepID=UPI00148575AD|nr:tetratricopeptide repeat protein [Chitinivorax sp. B]